MWLKDGVALHRRVPVHAHPQPRRRSASTTRSARSSTTRRSSATACGCGPRCCRPRSRPRSCSRAPTRARAASASWSRCGRSAAFAFFGIVQTKFHHYILPAVPGARHPRRVLPRRHARAARAAASALRRARHRHRAAGRARPDVGARALDRDVRVPLRPAVAERPSRGRSIRRTASSRSASIACVALALAARAGAALGVVALGAAGLAICIWSLQVYMPIAGKHWGMREAVRELLRAAHDLRREARLLRRPARSSTTGATRADSWTFDTFIPDTLQSASR